MISSTETGAWRDGNLLVLRRGEPVAPDRCIVTNEQVFGRSKISTRVSWGSEGQVAWMPTKIKMLRALADMKFVTVTFGLSGKVRATRCVVLVLAASCLVIGAALFVKGIEKGGVPPPFQYLGAGAVLIALALTLFVNTYCIIAIVSMDEEFIWSRGAKNAFLESLSSFSKERGLNSL